jgi:hypothetical protein
MRVRLLLFLLVLTVRVGPLAAASPAADPAPQGLESIRTVTPVGAPQRGPVAPGSGSESVGTWWHRAKRALHHLSGCALASAGLTYAMIAGVAFPGAAVLGLTGAAIVVIMCL